MGITFVAGFFHRGNSPETPNVWVLSTFHPNVWKQPPPPQCLTRSGGCTPTLLSHRAGSDVDATTAADRTRKPRRCHVIIEQNKKRRHSLPSRKKSRWGERIAEGNGGEGAAARGSGGFRCLPLSAVDSIVEDFYGERERILSR